MSLISLLSLLILIALCALGLTLRRQIAQLATQITALERRLDAVLAASDTEADRAAGDRPARAMGTATPGSPPGPSTADLLRQMQSLSAAQARFERKITDLGKTAQPAPPAPGATARAHAAGPPLKPTPQPAPEPMRAEADAPTLQRSLPLEPATAAVHPPQNEDFIRALNFPNTLDDREGFAALRRMMKDRFAARLVRAAQDVLTLLSTKGVYMEDLRPDIADPVIWRQFASGARGRGIAAIGGIHDPDALETVTELMRGDAIFRDAAHHFLRLYDEMLSSFVPEASDAEVTALGNTRTSRAFMLLGRVAGTFS